jgi:hypothetical protein
MTISRARLARLEARHCRQAPNFDVEKFFADLFRSPDQPPAPPTRRSGPPRPFDAAQFYADLFRASE